eukprot:3900169-Pleurochrysis_carterae.AAC.2
MAALLPAAPPSLEADLRLLAMLSAEQLTQAAAAASTLLKQQGSPKMFGRAAKQLGVSIEDVENALSALGFVLARAARVSAPAEQLFEGIDPHMYAVFTFARALRSLVHSPGKGRHFAGRLKLLSKLCRRSAEGLEALQAWYTDALPELESVCTALPVSAISLHAPCTLFDHLIQMHLCFLSHSVQPLSREKL